MKKAITVIIIIVAVVTFLIISMDGLNRSRICLIFSDAANGDKIENSLCPGIQMSINGLDDKRFSGEKDSKFKWMVLKSDVMNFLVGIYSLKAEDDKENEKNEELGINEAVMHDLEKPQFPDVEADAVAVIIKVEGNSEILDEKIEEIFLHFQTDFRQPVVFYVYGAKIPERIKLNNDTEIIYIYNKPEIIITDLTLIRSEDRELYLKNNGITRIAVK